MFLSCTITDQIRSKILLLGGIVSSELLSTFVVADVVINEIHYDSNPKTEPAEFVELFNSGDARVDVSGWRIAGGVDYTFPDGSTLDSGEFLIIAEDVAVIRSRFDFQTVHQYRGNLDNDGEKIKLMDSFGKDVDEVDYGSGFPWPTSARGVGSSMELIHPLLDNDLGGSWRSSSVGSIDPEVTYISKGSSWRYRKGNSEPSNPITAWREIAFVEDGTWFTGESVIGFGDGDDVTVLSDMQNAYSTVYFRKRFNVESGKIPARLLVRLYIDDGAIVWINGTEIARISVTSGAKDFDDFGRNHEASWEELLIPNVRNFLVEGTNVIAVHGLNASFGSSDFSFDLELKTPPASTASGDPSPGLVNTVTPNSVSSAPPAIRQVEHSPKGPLANENVIVSAKVTDEDGVSKVTLSYQLIRPGSYIRKDDDSYDEGWVDLLMNDSGSSGDAVLGDSVYSVTVPAEENVHRQLVRYRITVEDTVGNSVKAPYADDESPNFAYFVYNGVPSWTGAERPGVIAPKTFPVEVMRDSLPVYHLIANSTDIRNSQYSSGSDGTRMWGTMVYAGRVYDHIQFYNRGEASTYVSGKNKWRFKFNRARDFVAHDIYGKKYKSKWKTLNFNSCSSPWVDVNRGMAGIDEAVPHRLYQLAGVPSSNTHWVQFRVIDENDEAPSNQYSGDLWGLYLAIEHPDRRFLAEKGLPDGSVYKIQGGSGNKKNQGPTHSENSSDWSSFYRSSADRNNVNWWRDNFNLQKFYGFRAINRATGNVDLRDQTNYFMYHHPEGKWEVIPWDLDMMYAPVVHIWSGVIRADACLSHAEISIEYKNRCRDLIDLLFSDKDRYGGHAAQLVEELSQVINPSGKSLTMVDVDQFMWSYHPNTKGDHRGPWYLRSKMETTLRDNYTRSIPTSDHEGFQQNVIDYMHDTDEDGKFSVGDGDEDGYGFNYLSREARDSRIPNTPTISYVGPVGHPVTVASFQSGRFSDPQGAETFGSMKWRVGEVANPLTSNHVAGEAWKYEIEEVWDSGELTTFSSLVTFPTVALRPGHTYRVRVQHTDDTNRSSHWSEPIEFIAGKPDVMPYKESLMITEVMYNSQAGSSLEFIELKNVGKDSLSLTDVRFTKGIDFDFPPGTILGSGKFALVVNDLAEFQKAYGEGIPVVGEWDPDDSLSNGGEQVKLSFGAGTEIHNFTYDDDFPWPESADGAGRSLVLRAPSSSPRPDHEFADNWRPSRLIGGSPGSDDELSFDSWREAFFILPELEDLSVSGNDADPDTDGMSNFIEFFFGGHPKESGAAPVSVTLDQEDGAKYLEIAFARRVGIEVSFEIQDSRDLVDWETDRDWVMVSIVDNADGTETVRVRSGSELTENERNFVRIKVIGE